MENLIFSKLNQIKSNIESNLESYDLKQINNLIAKLEQDIKLCVKISEENLNFFKAKRNFRVIADLEQFSTNILKHKLGRSRRADIELELSKVSTLQNLSIEKLSSLLGKSDIKVQKPAKKITTKQSKAVKIKDQTLRWIGLSDKELERELKDLNKYPDVKMLKQAASSILKSNEKRFRLREKIINTIIKRISEEKALAHLGR